MAMDARGTAGRAGAGKQPVEPPRVLEFRVHGVNNTTPAALLDVPDDGAAFVAGDKLGSFWEPAPGGARSRRARGRGRIPRGVHREAYSWGGMVRTTPNFGGIGAAGSVAGVPARIGYALLLPFSLGNAVIWTRRVGGERTAGSLVTEGAARLFGVLLTLLFTTAAATVSLDMIGAQCAQRAGLCTPIQGLLDPLMAWSPAQRLALFALGPVLAVGALWAVSALSRQRYDVLPGMEGNTDDRLSLDDSGTPRRAPSAVLSAPDFWANRLTASLALAHVAAAVLLTTALVAQHAAVRSWPLCQADAPLVECATATLGDARTAPFTGLAIAASVLLVVMLGVVCAMPTMAARPIEERASWWPRRVTLILLALALATFLALLALLVWYSPAGAFVAPQGGRGLYGAGFVPLVIVGASLAAALTGVAWRPWRGRSATAWAGCGPAVLMFLSLSVAIATSSILLVSVGNALNGSLGASTLVRDHGALGVDLQLPSVWVGLGATILGAALLGLLAALSTLLVPRSVSQRAARWHAPAEPGDQVIPIGTGVLPLSQKALFARIDTARRRAALIQLVEPVTAVLAGLLGVALLAGFLWTGLAYRADQSLWAALPFAPDDVVKTVLDIALWGLGALGLVLVAVLAMGATASGPRPLGIVWDIACYLPRTGQPFGPPCYAERAVPEIAGRIHAWLREDDERTVVLSAHSMGAVLSVSALGLLASAPETRRMLPRVHLLTFGVQLRAYFGRMLPELLGPEVLGTRAAQGPGMYRRDPWRRDVAVQRETPYAGPSGRLGGTLLGGSAVRWVNLWRLTDFLGFPAFSSVASGANGFRNEVDRYAHELDTTGYMVRVGTHDAYFRTPEYTEALRELIRTSS